jgi:transcriptional repressor NrdR
MEDKVVDSRTAEDGAAIRRRRECLVCGRRFTTYERLEESPLTVIKRSGARQPFDRVKVVAGMRAACKNRPVTLEQMQALAAEVEDTLRMEATEVASHQVGMAVLGHLRCLDEVAYVRFASVYKGFSEVGDFQREVGELTKDTAPKSTT